MKVLSILALTLISAQAYAGSMTYSCESTDGTIKLTRENIVFTQKDTITGQINSLITMQSNDKVNAEPSQGEMLTYSDSANAKAADITIKVVKTLSSEEVAEDSVDCEEGDSGKGPGYSTIKKVLKAIVNVDGKNSKKTLVCFETATWSGSCHL